MKAQDWTVSNLASAKCALADLYKRYIDAKKAARMYAWLFMGSIGLNFWTIVWLWG